MCRPRYEKLPSLHSPNEIFAVRTKGGLLEEARYELVILYNEDVLLF